jgi:type I restriction enzyme S subunit
VARALFKSWFVNFDPVHARAVGRPTRLPGDVVALFPDRFGEDGLPAGWKLRAIADLFEVKAGNTPSTENSAFWGGDHQWATPKDLSGLPAPVLLQTGRRLTDFGLNQVSSGLLPPGSLLLSTRAPIGYMAFATLPTAINQGFAGFARINVSPAYAWIWCQASMDVLTGNAAGSTFPEISKGVLRQLPMLSPTQAVLDAFGVIADPLVERIAAATKEGANAR